MSRNFELLQEVGKLPDSLHQPAFVPSALPSARGNTDARRNETPELSRQVRSECVKLVRRLFFEQAGTSPHAVVFAGIESGSGSSTVCASVAELLAIEVGKKVCVVDANPQSAIWPQATQNGLYVDVTGKLLQRGPILDFAEPLQSTKLWLIRCQSLGGDSLSSSDRLRTRFLELREEFDYLLVDAPPVTFDLTSTSLAPLTDGLVLVVEANSTRREVARKAKQVLDSANVHLLGAVLNNRTFPIPEIIYRKI